MKTRPRLTAAATTAEQRSTVNVSLDHATKLLSTATACLYSSPAATLELITDARAALDAAAEALTA